MSQTHYKLELIIHLFDCFITIGQLAEAKMGLNSNTTNHPFAPPPPEVFFYHLFKYQTKQVPTRRKIQL